MTSAMLETGGRIEVAFYCSYLLDRGGLEPTADLRIWADVPGDAAAVVEVSYDGTEYEVIDRLEPDRNELDIQRAMLDVVRFVRLSHDHGSPIAIDALEAL